MPLHFPERTKRYHPVVATMEHPGGTGGCCERVAHEHDSGAGARASSGQSDLEGGIRGRPWARPRRTYGAARQCPSRVQIRVVQKLSTIAGDGCFAFTTIGRTPETPAVAGCCVRHFWLCDGCSRTHVLEYHLGLGVVIRPRHGNLPDGEAVRTVCSCPISRLSACLAE